MDLIKSTAIAKVFNLVSNIGAIVMFLVKGQVMFKIGIPMAIANVCGNYLGSHMAIKHGGHFIQKIMILVIGLLVGTLIWQLI